MDPNLPAALKESVEEKTASEDADAWPENSEPLVESRAPATAPEEAESVPESIPEDATDISDETRKREEVDRDPPVRTKLETDTEDPKEAASNTDAAEPARVEERTDVDPETIAVEPDSCPPT